jgi:hypothetical protein
MAEVKTTDRPIITRQYSSGQLIYLIFRRTVCFLTFGFVFPLSWSEDIDATAYEAQFQIGTDKPTV